ncbi:putative aspartate transaminase [Bifidobacterium cuniculi]|uniref:Aminotransferase n=2 Tax=Bifidobacterium cuniculi TaxID=1688 RepID=A0A087AYN7_9BIFI|nr:putative aspartate transaminase [Bifidobacterium cuniculi]
MSMDNTANLTEPVAKGDNSTVDSNPASASVGAPMPRLSRRAAQIHPFRAMKIAEQADVMIAAGDDVIKLNLGQPDYDAPEPVVAAMRALYDGRPLPYTEAKGLPELRRKIAQFYRTQHDVEVDPSRIVITAGGSSALLLAVALTVDDGDEVLIADPSYPTNRELVRSFGGVVVDVPTSADTRFHLTPALLDEYWSKRTKAVMVTSPSNPTGTVIDPGMLRDVCRTAADRGAWRIVDETYLDLADRAEDGGRVPSVLSIDPDAIVCSSFSKYFGMTGWRLGWMVVPERAVDAVDNLSANFFLSAHTPTQMAAVACFDDEALAISERRRLELLERRDLMLHGLEELGLPVDVAPNGAFYAYVDVSSLGMSATEFCERVLHETHVALTPGADFGEATADTHVRLSYAASREDIEQGLSLLRRFVTHVRKYRTAADA